MPNKKRLQSGQSLLETIFALWILIMVITAILALTVSSIGGQKESESQIVANNLAREGIEIVRNFRDSNWLAGNQWDANFSQATNNKARAEFNGEDYSWQISFNASADLFSNNYLLYASTTAGFFTHHNTDGSKSSSFYRRLIFDDICQLGNNPEEIKFPCNVDEKKIGIRITAQVGWLDRGERRTISLQDLIYDWK